ncbi:MAG TPA: PAS domain-containing protein, partial [Polyangia bacterium]|nr:PAS domain-containing protein [Polyangia bacterium]
MGDAREGAQGGRSEKTADGLDLFFELSVDLLSIANRDGTFRRLNPAWERVLGYPLADLYRMSWADLVHPDDQEHTLAAFRRSNPAAMM